MVKTFQLIILTIFVYIFGGCAAPKILNLRQDYDGKLEFNANKDYRDVYRLIIRKAREHRFGIVAGDLYTDIQLGEIVNLADESGDRVTTMIIDIKAVSEGTSEVTIYYASARAANSTTWKKKAELIKQWVGT